MQAEIRPSARGWTPLGWSSEVRPGRARAVEVRGATWCLFRTAEGLGALADRCPHRGYPLSRGRVEQDGLRCGYHGWLFDRAGACREVPGLVPSSALAEACRPERRVLARTVREAGGVLWMAPEGEAGEPPVVETSAGAGSLAVRGSVLMRAALADVAENILDVPHTAHLHGGLFRKSGGGHVVDVIVSRDASGIEAIYEGEPAPRGILGRLLAPRGGVVSHADRFLMPSIAQVDYGLGETLRLRATTFLVPVDASRTRALHVLSVAPRAVALVALPVLAPLAGWVLAQDARALKAQERNLARSGDRRFVSTEADVLGPHLRQMLERAARGEAPLPDARWRLRLRT